MKRITYSNVVATIALLIAVGLTPAGAHVTDSLSHLWDNHIEPKLSQSGKINKSSNPVHWTKLKGVPGGFADGKDGAPKNVVRYDRIKVVSGKGSGAQNGAKLENALAAADGASADKPRLILLEPGTFELPDTLAMRPFVDIAGSGQGASTLLMDDSSTAAVLVDVASNSTLRDLRVRRSDAPLASNPFATAVRISSGASNTRLENLDIRIEGEGTQGDTPIQVQGVRAEGETMLNGVEVAAVTFDGDAIGLFSSAAIDIRDSIVVADGETSAYGVYGIWSSQGSTATVSDSSLQAYGATARAARASHGGSLYIKDSFVSGSATGAGTDDNSTLDIRHSKVSGGTDAVVRAGGNVRVAFSELDGGTSGTVTCASNVNAAFTYFETTCPT